MKKNFSLLFLLVAFFGFSFNASQAATYGPYTSASGGECIVLQGTSAGTVSCYTTQTTTTYNNPVSPGVTTITVDHEIGDFGLGLYMFGILLCGGSPCTSTDVSTLVQGNGSSLGTVGIGASGQITPTFTGGSYIINLLHSIPGGDCFYESKYCRNSGQNPYITTDQTDGGTLTVGCVAGWGPIEVDENQPKGMESNYGGNCAPGTVTGSYEASVTGSVDMCYESTTIISGTEANYNFRTCGGPVASVQLNISYLEKASLMLLSLQQRVSNLATQAGEIIISLLNGIEHTYAQTGSVSATSTDKPSKAILVANINLTNAQLLKISENNYYISFVLTNKGETQSDVYYTFSFIDEKEKIVSTQTFGKAVTLEKNTPFFVTEKLNTPKGLDGTYTVRVQAYTQTGLPLGFGTAGEVVLTSPTMPSLDSCSLLKNTYEVNQILNINCTIKNITQGSAEYIISSKIFYGSEPNQRQSVSAEIINSKATTKIANLTTPGLYTIRTGLYERNGTPIGKEIYGQFIVKGISISILNLLLDKDSYARGEQAKVTASFGLFSTTPLKQLKINATITGKHGECADVYTTPLERNRAVEFMMPITNTCKNPLLTVQVLDDKNKVLAEKSMGLVTKNSPLDFKTKVGYGVALAILLMATFSLLRRAKKHGAASIVRKIVKKK